MRPNEYQTLAWSTARPFYRAETNDGTFQDLQLSTLSLALQSKAGEFSESVRKKIESSKILDYQLRDEFIERLGGVLWFVACAAQMLNTPLEVVMQKNIAYLRDKYPEGILQNKNIKF